MPVPCTDAPRRPLTADGYGRFARPGELPHAEWSEFDLDQAEWNIAANRMKTRQPHLVPLGAVSPDRTVAVCLPAAPAHLAERRDMMQQWAVYLDGLKNGVDVVPLREPTGSIEAVQL